MTLRVGRSLGLLWRLRTWEAGRDERWLRLHPSGSHRSSKCKTAELSVRRLALLQLRHCSIDAMLASLCRTFCENICASKDFLWYPCLGRAAKMLLRLSGIWDFTGVSAFAPELVSIVSAECQLLFSLFHSRFATIFLFLAVHYTSLSRLARFLFKLCCNSVALFSRVSRRPGSSQ